MWHLQPSLLVDLDSILSLEWASQAMNHSSCITTSHAESDMVYRYPQLATAADDDTVALIYSQGSEYRSIRFALLKVPPQVTGRRDIFLRNNIGALDPQPTFSQDTAAFRGMQYMDQRNVTFNASGLPRFSIGGWVKIQVCLGATSVFTSADIVTGWSKCDPGRLSQITQWNCARS